MTEPTLQGNLLTERLLHYRTTNTGATVAASLPELFVAMVRDEVRDFPSLRPHQRHPWHAFLVQLAAIALHHAGQSQPFETAKEWAVNLMALTPDDPDGAAWCLVTPPGRPAFLQAPTTDCLDSWNLTSTPDELDVIKTSKNHDLKSARMKKPLSDDWIFSLISLQTQAPSDSGSYKESSRMAGGYSRRPGIGIMPNGGVSKRWKRDTQIALENRSQICEKFGFKESGISLLWTEPWNSSRVAKINELDPYYIEVSRHVKLFEKNFRIFAKTTKTPTARIQSGLTGDIWSPIRSDGSKIFTIPEKGINYIISSKILFQNEIIPSAALLVQKFDEQNNLFILIQSIAMGKNNTNSGYHERRVPISKKVRQALFIKDTDEMAKRANERIFAIGEVRKMLWSSLAVLFNNAAKDDTDKERDVSDTIKNRANIFTAPFETLCDQLFFDELTAEIEAEPKEALAVRHAWLVQLAQRAELTLRAAFTAGPRSSQMRYRAQAAALSRLRGAMRSSKSKLPDLVIALNATSTPQPEENHAAA